MTTFSRLHKIFLVSLGAVSGSVAYYHVNGAEDERKLHVHNSWTTNYTPSVKWDRNWDRREPESIVKPAHKSKPEDQNRYNEQIETAKSKSVRHLFLIRHGQYNLAGATDKDRTLTDLGKVQADLTGQRLACLNIKWDVLVRSTMTRAAETAEIIAKHLDDTIEVKDCQLIEEGAPIPPEPPVGHWRPEPKPDDRRVKVLSRSGERYAQCMYSPFISFEACTQFIYAYEFMPASVLPDRYILNTFKFFQDSARIEAAFRRYFYRAPPEQKQDSYTLLVCHANVIRFFVCKALQFSPEGWLRISLNHGSITWLSIMPNGNVILRALSDTGHMEPKFITSR